MKYPAVSTVTLISLLSAFPGYPHEQPNPGASEAIEASQEIPKPGESEASNDIQEVQEPDESGASVNEKEIQKPTESEALAAAVTYLKNKDGRTVEKTEFIAWGTFSENDSYWPIKLRMAYKRQGSDRLRKNEYALKISRDSEGKLQAAPYWAWRADFK